MDRSKFKRGEDLPQSRLKEDDVRAIRLNRMGWSARQWAEHFGVHIRTIEKVRWFDSWRHI